MNKEEIVSKISEITNVGMNCGVDIYVCLKDDTEGFCVERMVSINALKDRVCKLALEILQDQYMAEDIEFCDIMEIADNKKVIYTLNQNDEYRPFSMLKDGLENVGIFDEKNIEKVLGFLFKLNFNSKKLFVYQQAYVGSKLQVKNTLRIIQKDDVFEIVEKEMLKIDKRGELVILDDLILVKNVKVLQDYFGFQTFVRTQAQKVITKLQELDILEDTELLKKYQEGEKLTVSKKLMNIKKSPVLEMDKESLLQRIPEIPRYKDIIHIENGKIRVKTKKDMDSLLKLLNDDYVKSELTEKEYDSSYKKLLEEDE